MRAAAHTTARSTHAWRRERRRASAGAVHTGDQRKSGDEIEPGDEDRGAMIACGQPRDRAVGDGPEYRGELDGESPQPEKLAAALRRAQIADERTAGRLARPQAQPREIRRDPEERL